MRDSDQWWIEGYCAHCNAPLYVNEGLGKTYWKDGGFDCFHELMDEDGGVRREYSEDRGDR